MSVKKAKKLLSVKEFAKKFPLSEPDRRRVTKDRQEIRDILAGKDRRLLVIVGPCSAWPPEAVLEYAGRLKKINDRVGKKLKLVMRVYTQKSRTNCGWPGLASQADPFGKPDIEKSLASSRRLMLNVLAMGVPIADEALFPFQTEVLRDLSSWLAIGARSSEDPWHRILASGLDSPVGIKNPVSGSVEAGVNGVVAAQKSHVAVFDGREVKTSGNPYAHLVLRGGLKSGPNYAVEYLREVEKLFVKVKVKNPAVIIDASHDNCRLNGIKDHRRQQVVIKDVAGILRRHKDLGFIIKGFMIESFIKDGNQDIASRTARTVDRGGLSITDPCLGWKETEELLSWLFQIHGV